LDGAACRAWVVSAAKFHGGAFVCVIPEEYAVTLTRPEAPPADLVEAARAYMLNPLPRRNSRELVDWDRSSIAERQEMMRRHEAMSLASPTRSALYADILAQQEAHDAFFRHRPGMSDADHSHTPLIFATPPQPWEQHARPGTHDDDETDPHTTPARDCQGMP